MSDVIDGHCDVRFDTLRATLADEISSGEESFCELWLGRVESICAGASQRSRRVILRFVMNELVKQAVEYFCQNFECGERMPMSQRLMSSCGDSSDGSWGSVTIRYRSRLTQTG